MPLISALRRLRKAGLLEFEANMKYMGVPDQPGLQNNTQVQHQINK